MKKKDAEYQLQQINLKLIKCKECVVDMKVDNELLAEDMVVANNELLEEKTMDIRPTSINSCEFYLISHPLYLFASSLCHPRIPISLKYKRSEIANHSKGRRETQNRHQAL
jgi:hypothetical protein